TTAPSPSPKSRFAGTTVWFTLPRLVAGHSTVRYPVICIFQPCFVVLAVDTWAIKDNSSLRGDIHTSWSITRSTRWRFGFTHQPRYPGRRRSETAGLSGIVLRSESGRAADGTATSERTSA